MVEPDHTPPDEPTSDDCIVPPSPLPPDQLARYSVDRDPHSEADIARYVESETGDETVTNVERIKREVVLGDTYDIWDVTTDKDRWWVLTNLTNLYQHKSFPSLDFLLSFHIGLMMRMRSRDSGPTVDEATPFEEVFRRQEQAHNRLEAAVEPEDFQAVGVQLRECLLSLVGAVRRRVAPDLVGGTRPQDGNFIEWNIVLVDHLCPGGSNKAIRQHLKNTARETWQLVQWLIHHRNAGRTSTSISVHACDTVVGHFLQILERQRVDETPECPVCRSREVRSHFDPLMGSDGDYYLTCASCRWSSHPGANSGGPAST